MICSRYDVVTVPFPFIDRPKTKKRPAVVLSNKEFNKSNHTILAMITTKKEPAWPGDFRISDHIDAGLRLPCLIRFKFFTLDNRLMQKKNWTFKRKRFNSNSKASIFLSDGVLNFDVILLRNRGNRDDSI
jgi:mRNA interferase MazF